MTVDRDQYWIPKLKQLAKRIITDCCVCRLYYLIKPYETPPSGQSKKGASLGTRTFQVMGLDFEKQQYIKKEAQKKTNTLGIYLEIVLNQTTEEFLRDFKILLIEERSPGKNMFRQCKNIY